ncbi:replication initiation protein [Escherichia coli]|nr:replication initiation protein [Escherichia coli]CTU26452.1 replication initiation protein [Escherichia coli]CTV81119.1 replication initiation protein [Escherichia coli]CTW36060.1 replication initiation protein [Escherichia coli]CTX30686.1 replication initiation protein [Escherichia coli]
MVIKNTRPGHWAQLPPEEQIRFWEDYEAGRATSFLVEPERSARNAVVVSTPPNPNAKIRPGIVLRAIRR